MRALRSIGPWVRRIALGLAALIVFVEEVGWRPLSALLGRLAQWPPLRRLERQIQRLPPRAAIALFLFPVLLLFPLKLLALGLIHDGRPGAGLALIAAAKLLGTAIVGRLFVLLEPQLRRFPWFVRALDWWLATKQRVLAAVRASAAWRRLSRMGRGWRAWWRRRVYR
jgi:hypothetical protein